VRLAGIRRRHAGKRVVGACPDGRTGLLDKAKHLTEIQQPGFVQRQLAHRLEGSGKATELPIDDPEQAVGLLQ
jgi:hypothetical protein